MKKTQKTLDVWDKIDALIGDESKPIQPDEFTMGQMAERFAQKGQHLGASALNRRMNQLLADGVVTVRKAAVNGRQSKIFRFV